MSNKFKDKMGFYFKKIDAAVFLSICACVFIIIPYLLVAMYAGPVADDFTNLNIVLSQNENSYFVKSLAASIDAYMGWQGTYFGTILAYLGGAIYHLGGMLALHIEFLVNIVFFFFSLFFLFQRFYSQLFNRTKKRIVFTVLSVAVFSFMVLYNFNVDQVFYWHTGLAMYTVPLSLALIAIGIIGIGKTSVRKIVLSSVLAFLAAGGILNVSAFVTGCMLLIVTYKSVIKGKLDNSVIIFISSFVGSLINTIAPGNYVRHATISNEFPIFSSFKYSFGTIFKDVWEYVDNGTIIWIFLICLFLFNKLGETDFKYVDPVFIGVILFMGSVIIDFPAYLGYASGRYGLPSRCRFVRRVAMVLFIFIFAINLTGWIAKKYKNKITFSKEYVSVLVGLFILSIGMVFTTGCWESAPPLKMWNDLYYNEGLAMFEHYNNETINILENSKGEDVVITIPYYDTQGYLLGLGLSSDPSNWVNIGIAEYFGNKSIVFEVGYQ